MIEPMEEIPYTKEEIKSMVKTIHQLREDKKNLITKTMRWIKYESLAYLVSVANKDGSVISTLDNSWQDAFIKEMEEV